MHCREAREAAIVLKEEEVRCPDPVLIQVCPPCCSLVHTQAPPCLSHAQDCPHLSPNHLSLVPPLQHLDQNQGNMGNWALVWCFAFAWLVEAWGLSGKDGRASRPLCWTAGNSCGGERQPACLRCVSSGHPNASSPPGAYVGPWTRR